MNYRLRNVPSQDLFTALLVGEAASEDFIGKLLIACVVRNRVKDNRWPDTYPEVILQVLQFSCFNDLPRHEEFSLDRWGMFRHQWGQQWYEECRIAAWSILYNKCADQSKGANHYHADYIRYPNWAKREDEALKHGAHIFYRL